MSGAASRLGIPAGTLRTWERRHGIGPSGRSPGGHRRYTTDDLVRLRAMRTLIDTGIPPAQAAELAVLAARAGREAGPSGRGEGPGGGGESPDGTIRGISIDLLVRAALGLDAPLLTALFSDAFARHGVSAAWQQLAVPVLTDLGARKPQTVGHGSAEHVLSGSLLATLLAVIAQAPPVRTIRPVLLAAAAEEQHVLPLHALHAELVTRGVEVRQLGGRVPRQALAHAVATVRPAAVFVWAQVPATADAELLADLPVSLVAVGGPGWEARPPAHVRLAGSLDDAVDLLARHALAVG